MRALSEGKIVPDPIDAEAAMEIEMSSDPNAGTLRWNIWFDDLVSEVDVGNEAASPPKEQGK